MNVTIYLPDELHQQVKQLDLNVSQVCQEALRYRVERATGAPEMERVVLYDGVAEENVAFHGRLIYGQHLPGVHLKTVFGGLNALVAGEAAEGTSELHQVYQTRTGKFVFYWQEREELKIFDDLRAVAGEYGRAKANEVAMGIGEEYPRARELDI